MRFILVCGFGLLLSAHCFAEESLVGTYRLLKNDVRLDGEPVQPMGKSQHGYLVITPKVLVLLYTGDVRRPGTTPEAKVGLYDSMAAYAGPYRVEGDKLIVSVDTSWNEVWAGRDQTRTIEVKGKRLALIGAPQRSSTQANRTLTSRSEWERID
jgi:hypothetical protein